MQKTHLQAPTRAAGFKPRHRMFVLAALLSAAGIAPQALAKPVVGATPTDVALATEVQNALLKDTRFQAPGVDMQVRARQGEVDLTGWVAYADDDVAARRIAGSVAGVKSATASLRSWSSESGSRFGAISAPAQTARAPSLIGGTAADLALARNVQAALLNDAVFQAAEVDIVVLAANDKINLSGWVGDVADDTRAKSIAAKVPGVRTVTSNLRAWSTDGESTPGAVAVGSPVAAPAPNVMGATEADRALALQVRTAVLQSPAFQDGNVSVDVRADQGRVGLSGWVSFADNGTQARQLAASVPGVKSVTSSFKSWSSEFDSRAY